MAKGRKSQLTVEQRAKRDFAKSAKFVKLAPARVEKALKAIRRVGLLASSNYIRTSAQSEAIIAALFEAVNDVRKIYEGQKKETVTFKLPL